MLPHQAGVAPRAVIWDDLQAALVEAASMMTGDSSSAQSYSQTLSEGGGGGEGLAHGAARAHRRPTLDPDRVLEACRCGDAWVLARWAYFPFIDTGS